MPNKLLLQLEKEEYVKYIQVLRHITKKVVNSKSKVKDSYKNKVRRMITSANKRFQNEINSIILQYSELK